jgi:hypothetical protein
MGRAVKTGISFLSYKTGSYTPKVEWYRGEIKFDKKIGHSNLSHDDLRILY